MMYIRICFFLLKIIERKSKRMIILCLSYNIMYIFSLLIFTYRCLLRREKAYEHMHILLIKAERKSKRRVI